nr:hypothetical protein [Marinobacter salicampi]
MLTHKNHAIDELLIASQLEAGYT